MRLDAFRFRHIGPFGAQGVSVSGLQPGLNVVAEHNERGKSSLLAALALTLFTPHRSWTRKEKPLERPDGTPVGEVDFVHDGRRLRLRKRFVKGRTAELIDLATGETIAVKGEAEDRLRDMLGSADNRTGPSGLLWVRQGDSLERAEDDGQVASKLESELSTLVGGERARLYLDRTESELGELLTKTGRVKPRPRSWPRRGRNATGRAWPAARRTHCARNSGGSNWNATRRAQNSPRTSTPSVPSTPHRRTERSWPRRPQRLPRAARPPAPPCRSCPRPCPRWTAAGRRCHGSSGCRRRRTGWPNARTRCKSFVP